MKKHSFKKMLALLLAIIMVIPAVPVVASADDVSDTTTEYQYVTPQANTTKWPKVTAWLATVDPDGDKKCTISTKEELVYFMFIGAGDYPDTASSADSYGRSANVAKFEGYTFTLGDDIVWNEGELTEYGFKPAEGNIIHTWTPYWQDTTWRGTTGAAASIKYANYGFRGTFDGAGHTISGLVIQGQVEVKSSWNPRTTSTALFRRTGADAAIKNISFDNMYVDGTGCRDVAALIGCPDGTVNIDKVSVTGKIVGDMNVGGLIARPHDDNGKKITISNSCVSGTVYGINHVVGGFMGMTCAREVEIINSVCCATVIGDNYVGGFIGAAEKLTMTNCKFFGELPGKLDPYQNAFACLVDLTTASWAKVNETRPSTNIAVSFNDCYFSSDSTIFAAEQHLDNPWYNVTYTYGDQAATEARSFDIAPVTTDAVDLRGIQMGTAKGETTNARVISAITNTSGIKEIGYEVIKLDKYIAGESSVPVKCEHAYKSLKTDFGLNEITAGETEGFTDAQYLTALGIKGVNATTATTVLIRNYIVTDDGKFFSAYMAVTFANSDIIGCVTLGEYVSTDVTLACSFDSETYDLAKLLGGTDHKVTQNGETLDSSTVDLDIGENVFKVVYTLDGSVRTCQVRIARRDGHRVVFNTNGGSFVDTQYVADGTKINDITVTPHRNNYTFVGWYDLNGNKVIDDTPIVQDTTFIAHWNGPIDPIVTDEQPIIYTKSSAALNINWRDYADAFKTRPSEVFCTLKNINNNISYTVRVTEDSAKFVDDAPYGAKISQGAGNWTVKITDLSPLSSYSFVMNELGDPDYTTIQTGTSVTNTLKDYSPLYDDSTKLMTQNGRFYDIAGNVVVLKGVVPWNVDQGAFEISTNTAALERMQAEGCNVIRITVPVGATTGYQNVSEERQENYVSKMSAAVDRATALGMYCIVDWGVMAGNNLNELLEPAKKFFGIMSDAYVGNPYVIYELANEPNVSSWTVLKNWEIELIKKIRENDPQATIIAAPNMHSRRLSETGSNNDPIDSPFPTEISYNIAHTFHCYAYTTTYNAKYNGTKNENFERSSAVYGWRVCDAVENGLTIVITEFSPADASMALDADYPDKLRMTVDYEEANKWVNLILENDINYTLFRFGECPSSDTKVPEQFMFTKGNQKYAYNGTWTYDMLGTSGKWYYNQILHATGFIEVADFDFRHLY